MTKKKTELDVGELFQKSGLRLHVFIGVLMFAGLQKKYEKSVDLMKEGRKAPKLMTLEKFNEIKEAYLKKVI